MRLRPDLKRVLGIGNSTGLGMAPFLHKHPQLLHSWFAARESAIASVRSLPRATPAEIDRFYQLLGRAQNHVIQWFTDDELVLKPDPKGALDSVAIGNASVVPSDSGYMMYYTGVGTYQDGAFSEDRQYIGLAHSTDGKTWTKPRDISKMVIKN